MKKYLLIFASYLAFAQDVIHPKELKCEYLSNPIGITSQNPRFSWLTISSQNGQKQTAYTLAISTLPGNLFKAIWSSGMTDSDQSVNILYNGQKLASNTIYYWKVKVWDKNNLESEWSEINSFTTGLMNFSEWKAKWIGIDKAFSWEKPNAINATLSARYLRKNAKITKKIKQAILHVSTAGLYEFYINGNKIGDAVLAPALSQTEKRMYANSYNITENLQKGINTFAAVIGPGRWTAMRPLQEATGEWTTKLKTTDTLAGYKPRFPKLIAQIHIEYMDGTKEAIGTDATWKLTANGPIVTSNEYDGEKYDANKEIANWNKPDFDDSKWQNAELVSAPSPTISFENKEPIKIMQTLKPIKINKLVGNAYIVDMGQNMVGWAKINFKGKKGDVIKMTFAELLNPTGTLYLDNMRTAEVTDTYICKGDENGENWEPKFTYHGFRYILVNGIADLKPENIEGKVIYDAVEKVGDFACSNPIMTKIFDNAVWGIKGNYRSMPTDCPQRDERFGWLGDRSLAAKGESFIFKNISLYAKWLQDINDAQLETGSVSDVVPTHTGMIKTYSDGVVWPSCFVILPYVFNQQTGDKQVIEKNYEAIKSFLKFNISYVQDGLTNRNTYGDWCMPPEKLDMIWSTDPKRQTSGMLMSSCYLYFDLKLTANFAQKLGKIDDQKFFNSEAEKIKSAINSTLYDNYKKMYSNNSITSNLLPLGMNIIEAKDKKMIFNNLIERLVLDLDTKMATGLIGGQWQMKALTDNGRADLAYALATNTQYPSWGYMINKGATTIWELWNGDKARPDMNSGNHVMLLGDAITWIFEDVAGIASDSVNVGFKTIIMNPKLDKRVTWAKASHKCLYGNIVSNWKTEGNKMDWEIEIPVNTNARVYIPTNDINNLKINDLDYKSQTFCKFIKSENGKSVFEFQSGKYKIKSTFDYPEYKNPVFSPQISIGDTTFVVQNIEVSIKNRSENATIFYTIDNSEPTKNSLKYTQPFKVNKQTTILAKAIADNGEESNVSGSFLDLYIPSINGWNFQYFEGTYTKIPDFGKEKLVFNSVTSDLNLEKIKRREDYWAIKFTSNLIIDKEGEYTFYISSDDGSRLIINDKIIAERDGIHGIETGVGKIFLKIGKYPIEIHYFEGNYGESLSLSYQYKQEKVKVLPTSKLNLK
ncbi:MAG: alpha-rhamnosidase [Bacteroidetes bacterium]|nr:MAG: alpha-rhamnosidase [Bacteroidota bacterium]